MRRLSWPSTFLPTPSPTHPPYPTPAPHLAQRHSLLNQFACRILPQAAIKGAQQLLGLNDRHPGVWVGVWVTGMVRGVKMGELQASTSHTF
jgi:hypothetical protein